MAKKYVPYLGLLVLIFVLGCSKKVIETKKFERFNPVTALTNNSFLNPSSEDFPWVRWNFPPETAEIGELEKH